MPRIVDIIFAFLLVLLFALPVMAIAILICTTSRGPAIHWSSRVGRNNNIFQMPKFRTMYLDTPDMATHLLVSVDQHITFLGKFLRITSLDEIPQLWSVIKGDMAFVGPRPALFNQDDLIALRSKEGVDKLAPGITGWAQVHGRDALPIPKKVEMDKFYLENRSIKLDLKILWRTLFVVLKLKGVSH